MFQETYILPNGIRWGWAAPENSLDNPLDKLEVVLPVQTHSTNIREITSANDLFQETDALFTRQREIAVGVRTADCVPVLLAAPDIAAVAAVHAGWKGTLGRIVSKTVDRLASLGADSSKMIAVIANCVCCECYEVGDELAEEFLSDLRLSPCVRYGNFSDPLGLRNFDYSKPHLDLPLANSIILSDAGLRDENIVKTNICTRHSLLGTRRLPSWRRDPGTTQRMISWIKLAN